ncbi:hypothetical protein PINS_up023191 [Pythium insidiosum]|nr:hypothetical protein PINS_up023191 [Pythium insidiosum]
MFHPADFVTKIELLQAEIRDAKSLSFDSLTSVTNVSNSAGRRKVSKHNFTQRVLELAQSLLSHCYFLVHFAKLALGFDSDEINVSQQRLSLMFSCLGSVVRSNLPHFDVHEQELVFEKELRVRSLTEEAQQGEPRRPLGRVKPQFALQDRLVLMKHVFFDGITLVFQPCRLSDHVLERYLERVQHTNEAVHQRSFHKFVLERR